MRAMARSRNSSAKDSIFSRTKRPQDRLVQELERIRKAAGFTEYRMAKVLGVGQRNYADMVTGKIKNPSGKVIIAALQVTILYTSLDPIAVLGNLAEHYGITRHALDDRRAENKKHKGMAKK